MSIITGIVEQGLIYGIMAIGISITYILLDFPDLTVDGSFPLGAAVAASLVTAKVNPYLTLLIAFGVGVLAGVVTGIIHVKFGVRDLLSGIIVMTGLHTINLTITGRANLPIFNQATIFNNAAIDPLFSPGFTPWKTAIVVILIALVCKVALDRYLETKSGFLLRATGDNPTLVTVLGKNPGDVKILGLAIANGLVALGGATLAHQQRFFEISMGVGSMVLGLASVIIGVRVFGRIKALKMTTMVLLGSIVYKACVALAIEIGFSANSLKLITAVLFFAVLVVSKEGKGKAHA